MHFEDLVNSFRKAQNLPLKPLRSGRKDVIVFVYTVVLENEDKTVKDITLAEEHQPGDLILDNETGFNGRITRKTPIFKEKGP